MLSAGGAIRLSVRSPQAGVWRHISTIGLPRDLAFYTFYTIMPYEGFNRDMVKRRFQAFASQ